MLHGNLRRKLDRFRNDIVRNELPAAVSATPLHYGRLAEALDGEVHSTSSGWYCLVTTRYPCDSLKSSRPLFGGHGGREAPLPLAAFLPGSEAGRVPVSSLLFLDIETTGLGGAGSVAFLIGCGSVRDGEFEVRQYLIPDYSDEAAMLESLLEEFNDRRVVVSYNGAAFDLPILRDRLIINRVARDIPMQRHIDLLHPVRRLFRRRLGDCTLVNVEKELLGFERNGDIPGYLIPSVYFEWLSEQRLDLMRAVLEHNRRDIVSMYYVAVLIARAFETHGKVLDSVDDLYSLSRIFGRLRETERVIDLYHRLDRMQEAPLADDIVLFHAQVFKRAGRYDRAVELWRRLAGVGSREGFLANVELAKYYEHKARDPRQAHLHARQALGIGAPTRRQAEALRHRLARLQTKLIEDT